MPYRWRGDPSVKPELGASINFNHPRAHGLVSAYLFAENGLTSIYDEVRDKVATWSGLLWRPGHRGPAGYFDGSGKIDTGLAPPTTAGTIVLDITPTSLAATNYRIIGAGDSSVGSNGIEIITDLTGSGVYWVFRKSSVSADMNPAYTLAVGRPETLVCTWGPAGCKGYAKGRLLGTNTTLTDLAFGGLTLKLGGPGSGSSPNYPGLIERVLVYQRQLGPAEIAEDILEPYAIWLPESESFYTGFGTAAATGFDRVTQEFVEVGVRLAPPANYVRETQEYVEVAARIAPTFRGYYYAVVNREGSAVDTFSQHNRLPNAIVNRSGSVVDTFSQHNRLPNAIVNRSGSVVDTFSQHNHAANAIDNRVGSSVRTFAQFDLTTLQGTMNIDFRMGLQGGLASGIKDLLSGYTTCAVRDVIFLVDRSTSMNMAFGVGTRFGAVQEALTNAINTIAADGTGTRIGIITFSHFWNDGFGLEGYSAGYEGPELTDDYAALLSAVSSMGTGGYGTPTGWGLNYAFNQLELNLEAGHVATVVLITDGEWNLGPDPIPIAAATLVANPDWLFYVVDVTSGGSNPSNVNLGELGSGYYLATDYEGLAESVLLSASPCQIPLPITCPIEFNMSMQFSHRLPSDCVAPTLRDIEVRFYDQYGSRTILAADDLIESVNWEVLERGGYGGGTISMLVPWEEISFTGNERVDIYLFEEPAYRGYLRVPEKSISDPEKYVLRTYGPMELLDKWIVRRRFAYGCDGEDISVLFQDIFDSVLTASRRALLSVVSGPVIEVEEIGVTVREFNAVGKTVTQALNQLCDLVPDRAIWGADFASTVNWRGRRDTRFYLRNRNTTVATTYSIGENVTAYTYPVDISRVVNKMILTGGSAITKNLPTNPGFENLVVANDKAGNYLLNPSFETASPIGEHWDLTGPDPTIQSPGNPGAFGSGRTGSHWLELDENNEQAAQTVYIIPGRSYTASCWARLEDPDESNSFVLGIQGLDDSDVVQADSYAAFNAVSDPPFSSSAYRYYSVSLDTSIFPSITKLKFYVRSQSGTHSNDGVLIDDCALHETCGVGQENWRVHPTGDARLVEIDWAAEDVDPQSGGLCIAIQVSGVAVTADTGELYNVDPTPISPNERYTMCVWWHTDGVGDPADSGISLGASNMRQDNTYNTTFESSIAIGNPSTWSFAWIDITTDDDAVKLKLFVRVRSNRKTYLDSIMLVQGELPAEVGESGSFWTSENYEATIDVTDSDLQDLTVTAQSSIDLFGLREEPVSQAGVIDRDSLLVYASDYFNAHASPEILGSITVEGPLDQLRQTGRVRLINIPNGPQDLFPSRIRYSVSSSIQLSSDLGSSIPDAADLYALALQRPV